MLPLGFSCNPRTTRHRVLSLELLIAGCCLFTADADVPLSFDAFSVTRDEMGAAAVFSGLVSGTAEETPVLPVAILEREAAITACLETVGTLKTTSPAGVLTVTVLLLTDAAEVLPVFPVTVFPMVVLDWELVITFSLDAVGTRMVTVSPVGMRTVTVSVIPWE